MKKITLLILLIASQILMCSAQNNYEKGMSEALQLWGNKKPMEAIALFERIAMVEKENWLPRYYIGLISATQVLSSADKTQATVLLHNAQKQVDFAQRSSPNNSEICCLQGLINTAWITLDPMNNGQKLSAVTIGNYKKAIELDSNNPRALYLLAEFQINMAHMFSQDTKAYYEMIKVSLEKFDNFKAPSAFYPNWGKSRAEQLLKSRNE